MRYLYKGKTKIGKIHMKTKVDTSFITAGPEDITAGKKTINGNYEEITGTMDVNKVFTELTSDATATAADITAGKIGYANGKRLVGTTPRTLSGTLMSNNPIDTYIVDDNTTINAGDFVYVDKIEDNITHNITGTSSVVVYSEGTVYTPRLIKLNDNKALVIYSDNNLNQYGVIKFITINGITVSYSDHFVFNSAHTDNITAVKVDDTHILISFSSSPLINQLKTGKCMLLTLNNSYTNIVVTDTIDIDNDQIFVPRINKLIDNKFVLTYRVSDGIKSQIITINNLSSLEISSQSKYIISSSNIDEIVTADLSPTKILLSYTNNNSGNICCLSISGNDIIMDTNHMFSNDGNYINIVKMSDTKFLLLYTDTYLTGTYARLVYFTNKLIILNNIKISDDYYNEMVATYISENRVAAIFSDSGNGGALTSVKIIIDPINTISSGSLTPLGPVNSFKYDIIPMYEGTILLGSVDQGNRYRGGTILLQINEPKITSRFIANTIKEKYVVRPVMTNEEFTGIANTSGSSGEFVEIITPSKS